MNPEQSSHSAHLENTVSVLDRLKQRTDLLTQKAEERRSEHARTHTNLENVDYFQETFQAMKERVEGKLEAVGTVSAGELGAFLDGIVADIQTLQTFANESAMFLASFQVKRAQEMLAELNQNVQSKIHTVQPKKKFGFQSVKKESSKIIAEEEYAVDESSVASRLKVANDTRKTFYGFQNITDETLTLEAEEMRDRQFNLINLTRCKVIAAGNSSTLQIANLVDCTVLVGPVSRSVFVKDCHGCTLVIACQQLRMHNTYQTDVYLHVTGAAIVENCKNIRVAPYNWSHPELESHYLTSGLDRSVNIWDKIEDFHWLNEKESSPNWSVLPVDQRVVHWE